MRDIDDKALDALCEQAIGFCEDVRQRANKSENEEIKYDAGDKHLDYEAARAFSDLAAALRALRARLAEVEGERDSLRTALQARWDADLKAARAILQAQGITHGFPPVKDVVAYYIEQCAAAETREAKLREALKRIVKADEARDEATIQYAKIIRTGDDPSAHDKCISTNNEFWGAIDAARDAMKEDGK